MYKLSFLCLCLRDYFNKLLHSSFLLSIRLRVLVFFLIRTDAFTTPKIRWISPESKENTRKKVSQWKPLDVVIIVLRANLHKVLNIKQLLTFYLILTRLCEEIWEFHDNQERLRQEGRCLWRSRKFQPLPWKSYPLAAVPGWEFFWLKSM